MSAFGWCLDGHHGGCPGQIVTFWVDEKGKAHELGEVRQCGCPCHQEP